MQPVVGPVVGVGGVAVRGGELLLVRRGHGPAAGSWSVPGGRVELGETLHEAVVREVAEETGLAVVVDRFLDWVERIDVDGSNEVAGPDEVDPPDAGSHFVILDFAVTPLDPEQAVRAGDDAAEAAWVPLADLSDYRLTDGLLDFLAAVSILEP